PQRGRRQRSGPDRARQGPPRLLQGAARDRVPRRAAAECHREGPEEGPAGPGERSVCLGGAGGAPPRTTAGRVRGGTPPAPESQAGSALARRKLGAFPGAGGRVASGAHSRLRRVSSDPARQLKQVGEATRAMRGVADQALEWVRVSEARVAEA